MTLLIDNYDSFTFNLYQMIASTGEICQVIRNDALTLEQIVKLNPDRIVISPGPGGPEDAGLSLSVIEKFSSHIPILGVCLGHQAIGVAFGGKVVRAKSPQHGKQSTVIHDGQGLFAKVIGSLLVTRYHSLVVERASLPDCLEITCETKDGVIMGLRHRTLPVEGVQFHPESIATESGPALIKNFLAQKRRAS